MTALTNFILISDALIEFNAEVCGESLSTSSIHSLEVHREELRGIWQRVRPIYESSLKELLASSDDNTKIDLETLKARYQSTYQTYVSSMAKIGEQIESKRTASDSIPSNTSTPSIHLPPCDTEPFNGDYLSWPTFRDLFTALYIKNNRLSPVEKLFHLNNKTRGEARDVVRKAPLTNEGFDIAWKALQTRFENKRLLINTQLRFLFQLKSSSVESSNSIKELQSSINSVISALRLYDVDIGSWDPIFVYLCSTRLSTTTLALWEQSLQNKTESPTWCELDTFLTSRFQTLETVCDLSSPSVTGNSANEPKTVLKSSASKRVNSYQNSLAPPACKLCPNEHHTIRLCPKFVSMVYHDRLSCIKKYKLCLNCFGKGHAVKDCKSAYNCMKCNRRHNTLLHKHEPEQASNTEIPPTPSDTSSGTTAAVQSCAATGANMVLLGTAIMNIVHRGETFPVRALFDSGSEASFISERLFNRLKLPSRPTSTQISGLNGTISARSQKICSLTIGSPINSEIALEVSAIIIPQLTSSLPTFSASRELFSCLPNFRLADPEFYKTSYIDMLIGADLLPYVMLKGVQHNVCESLIAQETIFGWILTGPVKPSSITAVHTRVSYFNEIKLDEQISRFWEIEDLPRRRIMSKDDHMCEENYKKTTRRDSSGRYIVTLPFKEGLPQDRSLGQSRQIAIAQFLRNEKRLLKGLGFKHQYDSVIQEYLTLGHLKQISDQNSPNYYLPHHAIVRPESATTKVRVVFNASNQTSNGASLNDVLHCGPSLQLDLTLLLLQWRFYKYVFNSDIEKMYRQILIDPRHTPYQRIIFRNSPKDDVKDYELQTVTFGVNCAPYLAIRTIHQLAEDVKDIYPLASRILMTSMYVDDVLAGSHDIVSALQAQRQLTDALGSAGFSLRKWTSNSHEFLKSIPKEHLLNREFLELEDSSTAKTLGVRWNAKSDIFYFEVKEMNIPSHPTKRQVLSEISKLFDPAGWLCPYIVLAKLLMRDIWLSKIGWDEKLSTGLLDTWHEFIDNFSSIRKIQIPRWVNYSPECEVQLHGFCDASEKAYAATIYIRVQAPSGSVRTHLLLSKSRVSPIKTLSIPRLELCGALLLAETIDSLTKSLPLPSFKVFCWTDSMIVLAWLKKPASHWKTFVANRVSKISEIVSVEYWSHVESRYNPADIASRGSLPGDLISTELWWFGPSWLKIPPSLWPITISCRIDKNLLETKQISCNFSYFQKYDDPLANFSSLGKALRVLAYVFRFIIRTRRTPNIRFDTVVLNASEIKSVQNRLIVLSQKVFYPGEYRSISIKEIIDTSSPLSNLNPFMDSNGLLRAYGRLSNSESLSYDERYPIIIPYNCLFSRLLLKFIHTITLHGANGLMLRMLRLRYWIPRAKNLIKTVIHQCKICVVSKHKLQTQLMAALPPERTILSRPFTNTGLDFAGPFDIKTYTCRSCIITKGYVCVFVCFSTRAIHLEVTSSLSTPAFLASFHRFISRRGCPKNLYSDNGTTFVGASRELARNVLHCSRDSILSQFAHQDIVWHFIPPGAPHMGGLWEAGVKSFKTHFRKMACNHKYTFEEFATILSRIEACLNSRPISTISENPDDILALTPGHFLVGGPILSIAEPSESDTSLSIMNRWRRVKALSQQFSIRWKHEYLKELHKRNKWQRPQKNLEIGALVVVRDECLSPTEWRLGRISKIYYGRDGLVRVADIMTQKGIITRPLVKIVILPSCLLRTLRYIIRLFYFSMPSIKNRLSSNRDQRCKGIDFSCRVCKGSHALRDCQVFRSKEIDGRMRLVLLHGYCSNCLAHRHSTGSCFTKSGCRECGGNHHTLLHIHGEENTVRPAPPKRRRQQNSQTAIDRSIGSNVSIASITALHSVTLFPTAMVTVQNGRNQHHARAVIDTCSSVSKISNKLVQDLRLSTTKLGNETICSVVIRSRHSPYITIEAPMEVNNKMTMDIPSKAINASRASRLSNIALADPNFFKPSPVVIIFGADLYSKIVLPGLTPSHDGLPVAMNTIFGWVLSGSFSN